MWELVIGSLMKIRREGCERGKEAHDTIHGSV